MFILHTIKPPQLSLSKWSSLLSEDVIQRRQIYLAPSSSLWHFPPIVFCKGLCNRNTFFPGTLPLVASPASLEQILGEENKAKESPES